GTVSASAVGPLLNVVSGTSTSADPNPANNDGTSAAARVVTQVVPAPPVNNPPVGISQVLTTRATIPVGALLRADDPDVGQTLTWTVQTGPTGGVLDFDATGRFVYRPTGAFTGVDTFVAQVCDNGVPVLCGTADVIIDVRPFAKPDATTTIVDTPVTIAI